MRRARPGHSQRMSEPGRDCRRAAAAAEPGDHDLNSSDLDGSGLEGGAVLDHRQHRRGRRRLHFDRWLEQEPLGPRERRADPRPHRPTPEGGRPRGR